VWYTHLNTVDGSAVFPTRVIVGGGCSLLSSLYIYILVYWRSEEKRSVRDVTTQERAEWRKSSPPPVISLYILRARLYMYNADRGCTHPSYSTRAYGVYTYGHDTVAGVERERPGLIAVAAACVTYIKLMMRSWNIPRRFLFPSLTHAHVSKYFIRSAAGGVLLLYAYKSAVYTPNVLVCVCVYNEPTGCL